MTGHRALVKVRSVPTAVAGLRVALTDTCRHSRTVCRDPREHAVSNLDPAEATSQADLVAYLHQLYVGADSPSYRELKQRTSRRSGELPGTGLERVWLGRSSIRKMLRGAAFPKKAFMLTFVEACGSTSRPTGGGQKPGTGSPNGMPNEPGKRLGPNSPSYVRKSPTFVGNLSQSHRMQRKRRRTCKRPAPVSSRPAPWSAAGSSRISTTESRAGWPHWVPGWVR